MKLSSEQFKKKEEALNERVIGLNQQISQLQGEMMTMRCEQEKESALITLKNKQLQSEIEEMRKKEAQTVISLRNLEIASSDSLKGVTEQFERKIKEKESELRQLKTNLNDIEEQNKHLEHEIQVQKTESEDQIAKLKSVLNKRETELARLTREKEES